MQPDIIKNQPLRPPSAALIFNDGEILLAVNSQFPRDMGAGAMRAALKAVKGEAIDEYVQLTPTKVFTSIDKIAIDTWLSERGYD